MNGLLGDIHSNKATLHGYYPSEPFKYRKVHAGGALDCPPWGLETTGAARLTHLVVLQQAGF